MVINSQEDSQWQRDGQSPCKHYWLWWRYSLNRLALFPSWLARTHSRQLITVLSDIGSFFWGISDRNYHYNYHQYQVSSSIHRCSFFKFSSSLPHLVMVDLEGATWWSSSSDFVRSFLSKDICHSISLSAQKEFMMRKTWQVYIFHSDSSAFVTCIYIYIFIDAQICMYFIERTYLQLLSLSLLCNNLFQKSFLMFELRCSLTVAVEWEVWFHDLYYIFSVMWTHVP